MSDLTPETLTARALAANNVRLGGEWSDAQQVAFLVGVADHAVAWAVDKKRLGAARQSLKAAEHSLVLIQESTHSHHPDCAQFTGPYDLGELEPPCTCWLGRSYGGREVTAPNDRSPLAEAAEDQEGGVQGVSHD